MTVAEQRAEALSRARGGQSWSNYAAIIQGFMDRGIPADEITPRENVFTYRAWQALGRQVRKGEKGIRVTTYIPMTKKDPESGEKKPIGRKPRTVSVFHVSQTDPIEKKTNPTPETPVAHVGAAIADAFGMRDLPNVIVHEDES